MNCTDVTVETGHIPPELIEMLSQWLFIGESHHIDDEEKRTLTIFSLIKYISKRGHPPPTSPFTVWDRKVLPLHDLDVSSNVSRDVQDRTIELYKRQCPKLEEFIFCFDASKAERQFIHRLLALRALNNGFPFLPYVIDCYTRLRTAVGPYLYQYEKEWRSDSEVIRALNEKCTHETLSRLCGRRCAIAPRFLFSPVICSKLWDGDIKINDS